MYGVMTRDPADVEDPQFATAFYEVKDVTGRRTEPLPGAINMVSCHGDTRASSDPELVTVDHENRPATRDRPYFDWGYVCPTHAGYRDTILSVIDASVAANEDVRIDDIGFARPEYCRCDRCNERFAASSFTDRVDWRRDVVTRFVESVADRVPGTLYMTVYPDPYPGHLERRSGIDVDALEGVVDRLVVPIYDMAYTTTYWIENIVTGFTDRTVIPFDVELYAVDVPLDNLVHAAEVADAYAETVHFAYHSDTAREAIERLRDDRT